MRQLASIAWKEWHEARIFLWIALGVFIGLPAIGALEYTIQYSRHFVIDTTPWVLAFGGVLAVFVGVGITCRDFSGHLEDFWRSRPLGVSRWLATKYFVGLLIVLAAAILPLLIQKWINPPVDPSYGGDLLPLLITLPVILHLVYSIGFLSGCVVRRTAHAAAMAFAAILLLYFLILILPPMRWLDISWITQGVSSLRWVRFSQPHYLSLWFNGFAGPAMLFGLILLLIALLAVRRGWHVDSGRRLMYGTVSSALLALIASVGVQLGSNLPVLSQTDLPGNERITLIRCDGHSGFVVTFRPSRQTLKQGNDIVDLEGTYSLRKLNLTGNEITLGEAEPARGFWHFDAQHVSPPLNSDIEYAISDYYYSGDPNNPGTCDLFTFHFELSRQPGLTLWTHPAGITNRNDPREYPSIYINQDRLYVLGERLVTLDISQPLSPRIISSVPFNNAYGIRSLSDSGRMEVQLPPIPELSPRQRLDATFQTRMAGSSSLEGDTLCMTNGFSVTEYHLTDLTDTKATFDTVARYDSSLLQRVFGSDGYSANMKLVNGFLYAGAETVNEFNVARLRPLFNSRMTFYDTRGDTPLRVAGHFAAPGAEVICPLPDGRALVGGDKIWLIAAPQRREQN